MRPESEQRIIEQLAASVPTARKLSGIWNYVHNTPGSPRANKEQFEKELLRISFLEASRVQAPRRRSELARRDYVPEPVQASKIRMPWFNPLKSFIEQAEPCCPYRWLPSSPGCGPEAAGSTSIPSLACWIPRPKSNGSSTAHCHRCQRHGTGSACPFPF
jgi:hypothetical protein